MDIDTPISSRRRASSETERTPRSAIITRARQATFRLGSDCLLAMVRILSVWFPRHKIFASYAKVLRMPLDSMSSDWQTAR